MSRQAEKLASKMIWEPAFGGNGEAIARAAGEAMAQGTAQVPAVAAIALQGTTRGPDTPLMRQRFGIRVWSSRTRLWPAFR